MDLSPKVIQILSSSYCGLQVVDDDDNDVLIKISEYDDDDDVVVDRKIRV